MATPRRDPGTLLPYLGLLSLIGGIVYQTGVQTNKIEALEATVVELKAKDIARSEAINTINMRGARIETKLDLAMEAKK